MSGFYGEIFYKEVDTLLFKTKHHNQINHIVVTCEQEDEFIQEVTSVIKEIKQCQTKKLNRVTVKEGDEKAGFFHYKRGDIEEAFDMWVKRRIRKKAPALLTLFKERHIKCEFSERGIDFTSKKEKRRGVRLAKRKGLFHLLEEIK